MEKPPVLNFTSLIQTLFIVEDGVSKQLADHLTEQVAEAAAGARYHKKKAVVTLTLVFAPGSGNEMAIFPDVTAKIPSAKPAPFPAFANAVGEIFLENPDQKAIPGTAPFRTTGGNK